MDLDRHDTLNVKAGGFGGVLGAGFEDNLWRGLDSGGCRGCGFRHCRSDGLAKIDAGGLVCHGASAACYAKLDALNSGGVILAVHILAIALSGTKLDTSRSGTTAGVGGVHVVHAATQIDRGGDGRSVKGLDLRVAETDGRRMHIVVGDRSGHRVGQVDDLGGGRRCYQFRRCGRNDRGRCVHLDFSNLWGVRQLDDFRKLDLGRLDLGDWRRWRDLGNDLGLDGLGLRLLNVEADRGELILLDGVLGSSTDDDDAKRDDDVKGNGGKERCLALAAVVKNAEVCELHVPRGWIFTDKRLSHDLDPSLSSNQRV